MSFRQVVVIIKKTAKKGIPSMKYSTKLSDSVHTLVLIALNPLDNLSSNAIANSIHTNPGYIRQIMSLLRKSGLIESTTGHAKPILAKEPRHITLFDIYLAIEGNKPLLHLDTHTNPECGIGINIQYSLQEYYDAVQNAANNEMKRITLQDIIETYLKKTIV